ncbi:MAG TPA: nitrate- and nitrite sensing domain-containing protein, partial [Micromonosporaceae bacterium]
MNRRWTIRTRILTLLLAPLIPLLAMLVFATSVALTPALNLRNARIAVDAAGYPAAAVVTQLQAERKASVYAVSNPVEGQKETSGLAAVRDATDAAGRKLIALSSDKRFRNAANPKTLGYISELNDGLQTLPAERAAVDRGASRNSVMAFYNGLIQITFYLYGSIATLDNHTIEQQANALVGMAQASEYLSREDAILAGPLASGSETATDYAQLVSTINTTRFLFAQAAQYLTGADAAAYAQIIQRPAYTGLTKVENELVAKETLGTSPVIDANTWNADYGAVVGALGLFEGSLANEVVSATDKAVKNQEWRLGIAIGAAVLMLIILLFFSLRTGRALIRRVAGLRMDALSLALDRLPSVVGRLRRGEPVDLRSETPPLKYGYDELGQLGDAFTRVQETAITSAVQEANLRHGFNQVFLNIARRSQTLLHRQLSLLDTMERGTEDPDQLEALFRIDHLATRMRRHAEDLVILAGSSPGRGWRNPVPFADVLRAAASEVEEYARISVVGVPDVGVAGRAVSDVVHLLAELLENATMFSPPETSVLLSGQAVPNGFVIEIEDRGLGMSHAAIDEANARLASPPDFDPANSSRLGLFVVTRLAARHGIRVTLRRSPYGGVTAVTLIPAELVVAHSEIGSLGHGAAIGARLPAPRLPAEDDTAERPIAGAAPTAVAVLDDSLSDATVMLTMDGLPKRSRQASQARSAPETGYGVNARAFGPGSGPAPTPPAGGGAGNGGRHGDVTRTPTLGDVTVPLHAGVDAPA